MGHSALNINQTIRDVYTSYCKANGFTIARKVEKLLIMDLYRAGYDVKELMKLNKEAHKTKGPELKKRPIIEPKIESVIEQPIEIKKEDIKEKKEENNGSM